MGKKTIKQALKDLFLGLGGNVSELSDNTSVSDYIEDLESAISGAASGAAEDLIDDSASSESTTYSSSKIDTLALPSATTANKKQVLKVNDSGKWIIGSAPQKTLDLTATYDGTTLTVNFPQGTSRSSSLYGFMWTDEANTTQLSLTTPASYEVAPSLAVTLRLSSISMPTVIYAGYAKTASGLFRVIVGVSTTNASQDFIDIQSIS